MKKSLCIDGRLPSLVNRQLGSTGGNRADRKRLRHIARGRGTFMAELKQWFTWGKHTSAKTIREKAWRRREYVRRFEETGRL